MTDNMDYAPIGDLKSTAWSAHAETVLSATIVGADNADYRLEFSTELGNPPEGGVTGDTTGQPHFEVLAPWTCEDCPDAYSQIKSMGIEYLGTRVTSNSLRWGSIYSDRPWLDQYDEIWTWPKRCTDCDTRFRKHKRTTKAIRAVFYHPLRMYKFEDQWCFVPNTKYKHIKLITLNHPTPIYDLSHVVRGPENGPSPLEPVGEGRGPLFSAALEQFAQNALSELKEKFRRKRKLAFWKDNVAYGRWFAEVTWTVHYPDGSMQGPTQWMPSDAELENAHSVSINPHLHVVACSKFLPKEDLTDWWEFSTHIRSTDRWMVCKDYLTKYVNKQQLPGRHQGTFGSLKKR